MGGNGTGLLAGRQPIIQGLLRLIRQDTMLCCGYGNGFLHLATQRSLVQLPLEGRERERSVLTVLCVSVWIRSSAKGLLLKLRGELAGWALLCPAFHSLSRVCVCGCVVKYYLYKQE